MEKLIVSMMRFSTAATLFGMEQFQNAMNSMTDGEDVSKAVDRFTQSLNAVTNAMAKEMDEKKRQTLGSMTTATEEVVNRARDNVNSMKIMDPREVMRKTNDLMKKTSDSVADMMTRDSNDDEPRAAADVLHSKSKK